MRQEIFLYFYAEITKRETARKFRFHPKPMQANSYLIQTMEINKYHSTYGRSTMSSQTTVDSDFIDLHCDEDYMFPESPKEEEPLIQIVSLSLSKFCSVSIDKFYEKSQYID